MRWKLLIITSLVAAILSAGGMYALDYWFFNRLIPLAEQPVIITALLIILLGIGTSASIFVYRHTARRRKLQAALTALLSLVLSFVMLFIFAQILPRPSSKARTMRPTDHGNLA